MSGSLYFVDAVSWLPCVASVSGVGPVAAAGNVNPPRGLIDGAEQRDGADEPRVRLKIARHLLSFAGRDQNLVRCQIVRTEGFRLPVDQREDVGATECPQRGKLIDPNGDGLGMAGGIGILIRAGLDRQHQDRRRWRR